MRTNEPSGADAEPGSVSSIIDRLLSGTLASVTAESESSWHKLWHDERLGALAPTLSALHAGALADRPSWVFVAGYQAALRQVFPELPATGFAAFVATEDQQDPVTHPGTVLTSDGAEGCELNGYKAWVAQSRTVEHLIVTAREGEHAGPDGPVLWIRANADGVELTHREAPGFLGAMSQGFAAFDRVAVHGDQRFAPGRLRQFARTEAKFVLLAGAGYLLAHAVRRREVQPIVVDRLTANVLMCAEVAAEVNVAAQTMGVVDREYQRAREAFESSLAGTLPVEYEADSRLLSMYSKRLQRRAERSAEKPS